MSVFVKLLVDTVRKEEVQPMPTNGERTKRKTNYEEVQGIEAGLRMAF